MIQVLNLDHLFDLLLFVEYNHLTRSSPEDNHFPLSDQMRCQIWIIGLDKVFNYIILMNKLIRLSYHFDLNGFYWSVLRNRFTINEQNGLNTFENKHTRNRKQSTQIYNLCKYSFGPVPKLGLEKLVSRISDKETWIVG